jgi:hypothetical protein
MSRQTLETSVRGDDVTAAYSVRLVTSPARLDEIYRFRHRVSVQEKGLSQGPGEQPRERIIDPIDSTAHHFAAYTSEGGIVGSVRTTLLSEEAGSIYESLYGFATRSHDERATTSVTSRLTVAFEHRAPSLVIALAQEVYAFGLRRALHLDYIDCQDQFANTFTRLGYARIGEVQHPEHGYAAVLCLRLWDREHLRSIKSPLLRRYAKLAGS